MHYNLHYEITEEVSKLITESLLRLYDKYKDDPRIFPKTENNKQ